MGLLLVSDVTWLVAGGWGVVPIPQVSGWSAALAICGTLPSGCRVRACEPLSGGIDR